MAITFSNCDFAEKYLVNSVCYRNDKTALPTKITIHIVDGVNASLKGL